MTFFFKSAILYTNIFPERKLWRWLYKFKVILFYFKENMLKNLSGIETVANFNFELLLTVTVVVVIVVAAAAATEKITAQFFFLSSKLFKSIFLCSKIVSRPLFHNFEFAEQKEH